MSLPKGYKRLEYIESSGTQYVDSGFIPNQDSRVEMDVVPLSIAEAGTSTGFIPYGASTSYNSNAFECYTTASKLSFNYDGQYNVSGTIAVGDMLHISHNKNKVLVLSESGTIVEKEFTYQSFDAPHTLTLFGTHRASMLCGWQQIKNCQIYGNGLLERDFVPAMLSNGEVGLYDRVFHVFYRNVGTGEFIAGPEAQTVPKAPANFRVESESDALVTLAWDASDKATGYRLYRGGKLLADTTETSVSVTVEIFAGAVLTVTAYNEIGEGAGAELIYFNAPSDPILFLVTNRTQQDVTERNAKGYYAASDLNRVGFAVEYLHNRLLSAGVSVTVSPVLTWTDEEWATPSAMTAYLKDVQTMRNALKVAEATPTAPEDMAKLTYSEANDIEAILVALDVHITRMLSIVDAGWASGLAHTGFYFKEAY